MNTYNFIGLKVEQNQYLRNSGGGGRGIRTISSRFPVSPLLLILLLASLALLTSAQSRPAAILREEFIFTQAPFASCHASTIAETPAGLVAAWFGGTRERASDTGIWLSRLEQGAWSRPGEVANGVQPNLERFPSWNPVLFQAPGGPLLLFYKVGPSPRGWWGVMLSSSDSGKTWSAPRRLPGDVLGPIKNKPVLLPDSTLLSPSSSESPLWRVRLERTSDLGQTWQQSPPLNDGKKIRAIQPAILRYPSGKIQILCRSKEGKIMESWSPDAGKTWSAMQPTALPNPDSGLDAVMLADGRALVVYNHTSTERTPLNVAVSADGKTWQAALVLESDPGEYSYPAVIQTSDGLVHITYTWKRERIKHVVLDPKLLAPLPMPAGRWPQ
jgi:predicted neuraminidase